MKLDYTNATGNDDNAETSSHQLREGEQLEYKKASHSAEIQNRDPDDNSKHSTNGTSHTSHTSLGQEIRDDYEEVMSSTSSSLAEQAPEQSGIPLNKDESNRVERLFICPHCSEFRTDSEPQYQLHIVLKHPRKHGYPNSTVGE